MTPDDLRSFRAALGLSQAAFAAAVGAANGRTVRGWEAGERNGKRADIPASVAIICQMATDIPAVVKWLKHRAEVAQKK